jgi:hypothetical protein
MKTVVIKGPLLTQSGYGVHARQIAKWLFDRGDVDVKILLTPWGDTPWILDPSACDGLIEKIITNSTSPENINNYDVSFQSQLPNEWDNNLAKFNIGVTAGVETDVCNPDWVLACNQMNMIIVPSEHTKRCFLSTGTIVSPLHVVPESYSPECEKEILQTIDLKTNNLLITSNKAIKVQNGNTLQRDFTEAGIRLNTNDFVFEGFSDDAVVGFGGVYSDDRRTSLTVNKYNNTILYKANNVAMGNVNLDRLFSIKSSVDAITFNANQISINNGISDLLLTPDGAGVILINEVEYFDGSNILNKVQDGSLTLANIGEGYTKFPGTFGLAIPNSDEISKFNSPEIGETIFNIDTEIVEIWNGTNWIPSTGLSLTVEADEFEDITGEWSLILG